MCHNSEKRLNKLKSKRGECIYMVENARFDLNLLSDSVQIESATDKDLKKRRRDLLKTIKQYTHKAEKLSKKIDKIQ